MSFKKFFLSWIISAIGLSMLPGCGPAKAPTAVDFFPPFASAGNAYLHMDRAATPLRRQWSTGAHVDHYLTYVGAGGQLTIGRGLDVYFHDAKWIFGPRGWAQSYIVEDPTVGAARDEIHVAMGYKATCPHLMQELHQASIMPRYRDYWHQNTQFQWTVILGFTNPMGVWVPGLQELVVARLESRR